MNNLNRLLLGLLIFSSFSTYGQTITYDQEYTLAKADFGAGKYEKAANRFKSLLALDPANDKSAYGAYYYGLSMYHLEKKEEAIVIFQNLLKNHKEWNKKSEAQLWLCKIYFELENPFQAVYYADLAEKNITLGPQVVEIRNNYYQELSSITLSAILEDNKADTLAAKYLASSQVNTSLEMREPGLLEELIVNYHLDSADLGLMPPADVFKEKYKIAVLLPLFSERLWHSGVYLQKSLAVDIYEGIQLALEELDSTKISIEVFDTQRDSSVTNNIIESGQLLTADAILGPLYPEPISLISEYSKESKLNFVNPVSTNSDVITDNPYAFLLRTGAESIGDLVSDYTLSNIDTGAFAVYYGRRKTDSLTAYNYASTVRADSFYLAIRQKTSTSEARQIFDSLTSSVEVLDSAKLAKMIEEGEDVRFKPQMDSLLLKVDSLGHIFIASDNQAIASEVMAAIAYRGDTTQIIGVGNWFSVPNAGLDLMESLNVWLAMQEFENMLLAENISLSERYRAKFMKKPSKYVYYGYYGMNFLANSLLNYGVYFQNGYRSKGNLDPMFDFKTSQDNQRLVLYKLQDGIPIKVHKQPKIVVAQEE